MKKPTVYLDTNVISMLHYGGSDIDVMSARMVTRDWWESERRHFEVFASVLTERELADGVYRFQSDCLKFVRRLSYVPRNAISRRLAQALLDAKVIPVNKPVDAAQLALAASHEMDYLLTWNYSHLANPITQARGEKLVTQFGLRMPLLVSPESIPQVRYGHVVRRPRHD